MYYDSSGYGRGRCDPKVSAFEDDKHRMLKKDSERYQEYWRNIAGIYEEGDINFMGPSKSGSWTLVPNGEGAHLVERSNVVGRSNLQVFDKADTPRFYPYGSPQSAGEAHKRLHRATKSSGISLYGNPNLSDQELLQRYFNAYHKPGLDGIKGDLRTPDGKIVIARNVTPGRAFDELMKWYYNL